MFYGCKYVAYSLGLHYCFFFRFKCPMLYGEMDPDITKHEKIEWLVSSNIDHWLCNIYFEIVKLPRYVTCWVLSGYELGAGDLYSFFMELFTYHLYQYI